MLAILAEDISDAEVLMHLVRRRRNDTLPIKTKGYGGCAQLCRKGGRDVRTWVSRGVTQVIVCHDADRHPPQEIREKVLAAVIRRAAFAGSFLIAVPVEAIEAWMIADERAISRAIPSLKIKARRSPERIPDPKEWIIRESRTRGSRPLYVPTVSNPAVARHLRFDVVVEKCPSFRAFLDWLDQRPRS